MSTENEFFRILWFRVQIEEDFRKGRIRSSEATIKVQIKKRDGTTETEHKVAEGNGPVNALDNALRKALIDFFPEIAKVGLIDYEVHKKNGDAGTESFVEVKVTSSDGKKKWVTKGISDDIIKASLIALANGLRAEIIYMKQKASA